MTNIRWVAFTVLGTSIMGVANAQYIPWFGPPLMMPYYPMGPFNMPTHGMRSESGIEGGEYVVNLYLHGIDPASVEIRPNPAGLTVRYNQQSDQSGPGGFSTSSMWMSQQIALPPGLNLGAMRRLTNPEGIQIRIPFAGWR